MGCAGMRFGIVARLARVVGSVVSPDGPMGAVREPDLEPSVLNTTHHSSPIVP